MTLKVRIAPMETTIKFFASKSIFANDSAIKNIMRKNHRYTGVKIEPRGHLLWQIENIW